MSKLRLLKRVSILAVSAVMVASVCTSALSATTTPDEYDDVEINFAKALQMSLYFYDANKIGRASCRERV